MAPEQKDREDEEEDIPDELSPLSSRFNGTSTSSIMAE